MKHLHAVPSVEGLESRRHFAVSYLELSPATSNATVQTLMVTSDDAGDVISISSAINPVGAAFFYKFKGTSLPAAGVDADYLRVFGYGGDDDITLNNCTGGAWVSGNTGADKITVIGSRQVRITPLTPSDADLPQPVVDGADTIDLQDSRSTEADGGDSADKFTASGNNSNSTLRGGAGMDDFAVGGTFGNGKIFGDGDRDIVSGSGFWPDASVLGGGENDWIDLRPVTGMGIVIHGGDGNDIMYAGSWGNTLIGGDGRDWMTGGVGDDFFDAVDANYDVIKGGAHDKGDRATVDAPLEDGTELDWLSGVEFVTYGTL